MRRYHRLIAAVVLRTAGNLGDSSSHTVDDLIQETYLKLCSENFRLLRDFRQRHSDAFLGFIRVVAANVVRDHFKALNSKKRGGGQVESISADFVPAAGEGHAGSSTAMERALLIDEIEHHLGFCISGADRERNAKIFWLYYRVGLSAGAIAALPDMGLTTKGVESLLLRITRDLRQRISQVRPRESKTAQGPSEGIVPAESF